MDKMDNVNFEQKGMESIQQNSSSVQEKQMYFQQSQWRNAYSVFR